MNSVTLVELGVAESMMMHEPKQDTKELELG